MIRIITIAIASILTSSAHADRLDPAINGDDVTVCHGLLTTNGTCIGSESNVLPPVYKDTTIYRRHQHHDRDDQHDDDRRDDQ